MYIAGTNTRCAIVTDWRLKTDADLDATEPKQTHVLDFWKFGRWCLGRAYNKTTRIALFDHGAKPSNAQAAVERAELVKWIIKAKPKRLFVIPTPDSSMGAEEVALKGTHCWAALHAPDTLDAMRGTRWRYNEHTEVTALHPVAKRVKELQRWSNAMWLRARDMPTLTLSEELQSITPSTKMLKLMESMRGRSLSIDLEFNPTTDIVTAIGLSDGVCAVSIPWDRYTPRNNAQPERGINDYGRIRTDICRVLRDLLAAETDKVAHNFIADIPRLTRRGFRVNGTLHDTFAAHAIAFCELRHGLQHACASLLPVPPWKSLYKPSRLARGITRDDAEFWIGSPKKLRQYNILDAFYTHTLAKVLMPHVETIFK